MASEFKAKKATPEVPTVKVNLPNGKSKSYTPLSVEAVEDIAAEAGLVNFDIRDGNGKQLHKEDFPVNEGEITLSEYNEAKDNCEWTTTR